MKNILDLLAKGGIIMIPLFLCSIAALAVVIEKAIALRRRKIIVPEVVGVLENVKGANDFALAVAICEKHRGPFAGIVRLALENRHLDREELKESLLDQGRQEVHRLERGLGVLETIAGIAPLLGLLGTVLGLRGADHHHRRTVHRHPDAGGLQLLRGQGRVAGAGGGEVFQPAAEQALRPAARRGGMTCACRPGRGARRPSTSPR